MKRNVIILLLAVLLTGNATVLEDTTMESANRDSSDNIELIISLWNHTENSVFKQQIKFNPVSHANITIIDIPSYVWFIVLQVHTFQYNITIGYNETMFDKVSNRNLFGSNIGLYFNAHNKTTPIQAFLKNDNVLSVDMLLVIITYDRKAPIPGGCNVEFDIEIAPYQKLHAKNEMIIVDIQPASMLTANGHSISCDKTLEHKMYRLYLPEQDFTPETYFEAITSMLTVQNITQNGNEIPPTFMNPMRRIYSAYVGTGSVYAAVATYEDHSSAYIPIFTYACNPLLYPESCQVLNDTYAKVFCALVLIVGFVFYAALLYYSIRHRTINHIFTFIDGLLSNCMISGIFGYILAVGISNYATGINILIGLSMAILSAVLFAILDICEKLPRKLPLGFLCACITYLYAPARMFYILEREWLFWPMFLSLMIVIAYLARIIPSVFINAIFGSYFIIIAFDYYIGSNLKYIIITFIRRVTVPEFRLAFVYPPYQDSDLILIIIWFALIVVRLILHYYATTCNYAIITTYYCAINEKPPETASLLSNSHHGNYSGKHTKRARKYYRRRYY